MKKLMTMLTAALLCITMLVLGPTQVVASAADGKKTYISEVKVGMGETSDAAAKELLDEGFTILKDDSGNYADLNKDAGSKSAFREGPNQKIVYLGYKTTNDANDAITDLAVMNMNGGYSFEDYEKLMQSQMDNQIKPFVDRFIATLNEYRDNLKKPQDSINYKRANYYKTLLNKLTDDDTGDKPLGDLLVNKTKYELGDEAYNKLSDSEKKNHCDILTLLMQGNGQAVMLMETELTKSADSADNTWIDRFMKKDLSALTDEIKKDNPDLTPTEINQELDKKYGDAANKIRDKWGAFNEILLNYDNAIEKADEVTEDVADSKEIKLDENSTDNDVKEAAVESFKNESNMVKGAMAAEDIVVHDYLESVNYGEGTLLDFFQRDSMEFNDNEAIRDLYPIVDALSGGQLAGLDFLSVKDMILMAVTDENGYNGVDMSDVQPASIYQDVNREIYEKGGVALTDDAMRAKATAQEAAPTFELSKTGIVLWSCTAASGIAAAASAIALKNIGPNPALQHLKDLKSAADAAQKKVTEYGFFGEANEKGKHIFSRNRIDQLRKEADEAVKAAADYENGEFKEAARQLSTKSKICKFLTAGFTILGAVLAGISIYTTIKEMMDFYKVDFAPIPKYIVERTDITDVNERGEEEVFKNQTAYYKAVTCNRTDGSSNVEKKNHEVLLDRNDLNGDVGQQWLSLYSVKYENGFPILADSLKFLNGSTLPDGYSTGIHMFGKKTAFNLTHVPYTYNDPNDGTYVYYKNDAATAKDLTAAGSAFSGGYIALGAVFGMFVGSVITLIIGKAVSKKKKKASA